MIDSHCHLAGKEFADDLDAVIQRARDAGVSGALTILAADDEEELNQASEVSQRWPDVRFSIGVHPHAASTYAASPDLAAMRTEKALDAQPLARALGEIGLDYHYNFAPREVQQAVFREQIRLAKRRGLPIVIHTREAEDDTLRILEDEGGVEGVFHCFTGDRGMAERALDAGFHLSLAGIVTFPRAVALQDVARSVPLDRLLIETDSPFLAPVPHRGKRNEPAHVQLIATAIATLRGIPLSVVSETTSKNFQRLFNP